MTTTSPFTEGESADLYTQWRTSRMGKCPSCGGVVASERLGSIGAARSRMFTCKACGKTGLHEVPNGPVLPGEESLDPGQDRSLGRGRR